MNGLVVEPRLRPRCPCFVLDPFSRAPRGCELERCTWRIVFQSCLSADLKSCSKTTTITVHHRPAYKKLLLRVRLKIFIIWPLNSFFSLNFLLHPGGRPQGGQLRGPLLEQRSWPSSHLSVPTSSVVQSVRALPSPGAVWGYCDRVSFFFFFK